MSTEGSVEVGLGRTVVRAVRLVLTAGLLVVVSVWWVDEGGLGPRHPLPTVGSRSCPIPAHYDRYTTDPAYEAAWDEACGVFATQGVETGPLLDEIGPLPDTRICALNWDPVAEACVPATALP